MLKMDPDGKSLKIFHYILQSDACAFIVYMLHKKPMSGMNLKVILVPERNKFVFQSVPTGTPMKVPMFTR